MEQRRQRGFLTETLICPLLLFLPASLCLLSQILSHVTTGHLYNRGHPPSTLQSVFFSGAASAKFTEDKCVVKKKQYAFESMRDYSISSMNMKTETPCKKFAHAQQKVKAFSIDFLCLLFLQCTPKLDLVPMLKRGFFRICLRITISSLGLCKTLQTRCWSTSACLLLS